MTNEKIKDKVLKTEKVKWRELKVLQVKNFKELSEVDAAELRVSILKNEMINTWKVWEDPNGTIWILDGVHRQKMMFLMEKTENVPFLDEYTASFIDCKDKREAAKYVLLYSSSYAKVTEEGLRLHLETFDLQIDEVKLEISPDGIDMKKFMESNYGNVEIKEKEYDENIEKECPSCGYKW
jgi:hypothetical protein